MHCRSGRRDPLAGRVSFQDVRRAVLLVLVTVALGACAPTFRQLRPLDADRAADLRAAARPDAVAWDVVAVYPPGARWDDPFPAPSWSGEPVVKQEAVLDDLLGRL
jgi:hypothetical protein